VQARKGGSRHTSTAAAVEHPGRLKMAEVTPTTHANETIDILQNVLFELYDLSVNPGAAYAVVL
jgi:hypothetical protein